MNGFEFILTLVTLMFVLSIVRYKMGIPARSMRQMMGNEEDNARLKAQVQQLQDRVRVLEQIVTDSGAQTAAQIEALREHKRIETGEEFR